MPKISKHPRFRTHVRKGKSGQVWVSYSYDGRPDGQPDTPLGNNYEAALEKWAELYYHKPRIKGTLEEAFSAWEKERLPEYDSKVTREGYARNLKELRRVFATATWDSITFPTLKQYLKKRTAKTQGNREMALLSIIWRWAFGEGYTTLPWPAAGMERSKWKNKEKARTFEVSDTLFAAVYAEGNSTLKTCMDLASATGLRLTDCRTIQMPAGDQLRVTANKTKKPLLFSTSESPVLSRIVSERKTSNASSTLLLLTPSGKPVSERMLRDWWDEARAKAAAKPENKAIKDQIEAMFLRDMRKRAASLAGDLEEASKLLQHSSTKVTQDHYFQKPTKVRPVR